MARKTGRPATTFRRKRSDNPNIAEKAKQAGDAPGIGIQLASLRRKSGLSQKELAKRVRTSQQQISRLESSSYKSHSVSMLRRVARALGAALHVEIYRTGDQMPLVAAEGQASYEARIKDFPEPRGIHDFERDFLRKEKVDFKRNLQIADGLYREAVTLGIIPLNDPLEGIEVDLKIAKAVNRV